MNHPGERKTASKVADHNERANIVISVGHQAAVCQRLQSDFSAKPFSQEQTRFLRGLWISVEAECDLAAIELCCARDTSTTSKLSPPMSAVPGYRGQF